MNNLKLKKIIARNCLCFGPEGIELDFTKMGNIILIRGENLDVKSEEEILSNNGVGKSSIIDIISLAIHGQTVKNLTSQDVIHNKVKKKLYVEIMFDNYRIVRTKKPDKLQFWKSDEGIWDESTEITLGKGTQNKIIEELGMNFDTFVNTVVFADNNSSAFLECKKPVKREIVENLLSLSKYKQYLETAKKARDKAKNELVLANNELQSAKSQKNDIENKINQVTSQENTWFTQKQAEITAFSQKIENKKHEIGNTDSGAAILAYDNAQTKIITLKEDISKQETIISELNDKLILIKNKQDELNNKKLAIQQQINEIKLDVKTQNNFILDKQNKISLLKSNTIGVKCDKCAGEIKAENIETTISGYNSDINDKKNELTNIENKLIPLNEELITITTNLSKIAEMIKTINAKVQKSDKMLKQFKNEYNDCLKINKPDVSYQAVLLQEQLASLQEQMQQKASELVKGSPFKSIIDTYQKDLLNKIMSISENEVKVEEIKQEIPLAEFWVHAFGDSGIRKFIIDGIIPILNYNIAYWLDILIDGQFKFTFDNELDELIERNPVDGDPFVYNALSGGEKRRINLAVSQAFANVMEISTGKVPSFVFLDEVSTNIDPMGIQGVYSMITELAKEKQVFITTHDQELLNLLSGCKLIYLRKKDGFTTLVDK